jgi:hypothetical protein
LKKVLSVIAVTLGILLLVAPVFAQTANGRISGAVKDQTGGSIVGAAVVVTDTARGLTRNLTTDEAGAYLAPNLIPGSYTVRVTFTGFQAFERTNITLGVGQDLFVDVVLQPGSQTQTVTITEEVPLVNTTSSTLGGTLSNSTINDLPLNGRNFTNLLELRPGVVLQLGNNSGGTGAASANGLRPEQSNEYLVEGLHGMSPFNGQPVMNSLALQGDAATVLPIDAIQDFNVQQNTKAEYGQRAGNTTNIGLKSGTNSLHGTAYSFFRNDALDARNYFNFASTQSKTNINMQQFGATVGGPIKKDKLFFFAGYEQQLLTVGNPAAATVPFTDPAMLNCSGAGTASFACTPIVNSVAGARTPDASNHLILACLGVKNAVAPNNQLSAQSLSLVGLDANCNPGPNYLKSSTGASWLVPHGGNDHGATANTAFAVNSYFANSQSNVRPIGSVAKIDYMLNAKNTISGFLFKGNGNDVYSSTAAVNPDWRTRVYAWATMVAGTWTYLPNSSWANAFRVGYARLQHKYVGVDTSSEVTAASLGLNTGVSTFLDRNGGFPQALTMSGFSAIGSRNTEIEGPNSSIEVNDQLNYLRGTHSIKFGGSIMTGDQTGGTWANTKGTFGFGSGAGSSTSASGLVAFLVGEGGQPTTVGSGANAVPLAGTLGNPGLSTASLFYGNPESHIRRPDYSLFVQDDWRVRPRLTLNLGMRYELAAVPHDRDHILGSFDTSLGLVQEGIQIVGIHNPDHNNFAPRVGFAWDVRGNGKTVVRAGGSIVHELVILRTFSEVGNAPGLAGNQSAWVTGCSGTLSATIPIGATSNCSGSLLTSGGTRDVGSVSFDSSTILLNNTGAILWDRPNPNTQTVFPSSAIHNCSPAVKVADVVNNSATQAGRAGVQCAVNSVDPNLRTPYVETWTLSIQQALRTNVVLDIAYVGNHGTKLLGRVDQNEPVAAQVWNTLSGATTFAQKCAASPSSSNCNGSGSAFAAAVTAARPFATKFPYISVIQRLTNLDTSNYNGLQVSLTARNFYGLSTNMGYTWSHALDVNSGNGGGIGSNSLNPSLDYGAAASDLRHRFTFSPTYALPEKMGYGGLLSGWKVNGIFRWATGRPTQAGTQFGDSQGVGRNSRPDFTGDYNDFVSDYTQQNIAIFHPGGATAPTPTAAGTNPQVPGTNYVTSDLAINNALCKADARSVVTLQAFGCWTMGNSAITPAPLGVLGTMTKGELQTAGYVNLDMSVNKRQRITERFSAEFRAELFNVLNHPVFNSGSTSLSCSSSGCAYFIPTNTPDVAATNPVLGSGGARRLQFGVKILF